MATRSSYITNEIIITAMDRFVWFVLLIVMSHLVTEFTRVTGYSRGSRNDVILVNDTLLVPMPVQNMVLYPGQEYGLYDRPNYYASNNNINNNNNNNKNNNNAEIIAAPVNTEQGMFFSFRPLIDSIFEIPISTLRAVNNLVARLTGSYQQSPTQQRSVDVVAAKSLRNAGATVSDASTTKSKTASNIMKKQLLHEQSL